MKASDLPFEKFKKKCYAAEAPKEGDFTENTQLRLIALLDYIPISEFLDDVCDQTTVGSLEERW